MEVQNEKKKKKCYNLSPKLAQMLEKVRRITLNTAPVQFLIQTKLSRENLANLLTAFRLCFPAMPSRPNARAAT
jgi:hypothetical protein